MLDELGGRYVELAGTDTPEALVRFARAENATQLVLGASRRSRWTELVRGSVINRVLRDAGAIDVHVLSTEDVPRPRALRDRRRRHSASRSARARAAAWVGATVAVPLLALALLPFDDVVGVPGTLLVLLLAPVAIAVIGGFAPALVASCTAFVVADWFFIQPTHSLRFAHAGDALALAVFVAVAAIVSGLVDRLSRRSAELARAQVETEALAQLATGTALLDREAVTRLVSELRETLDLVAVSVLAPDGDGWRVEASCGEPVPSTPDDGSFAAELVDGSMLVVAGRALPAEDRRLLAAFAAQLRLAETMLRLQSEAAAGNAHAEARNIRDALLAAVSHDFRTPLANIKAAATSVLSDEVAWSQDDIRAFCKTIDDESDHLHRLVTNLLDMGRLQTGMVGVRFEAAAVDECVYAALAGLPADAPAVDVRVPEGLVARADAALLERVLANVIVNALNWTPDGSAVRVEAARIGENVDVAVVDRGAGIPADQRDAVFMPFQRLGDGGRASYDGIGLGLAVSKGFMLSMGGAIALEDTPGGGTTVVLTLPAALEPAPTC
jgi:two-component system sensor histidine kinase KdpD